MVIYSPDIRLNDVDRALITALSKHLIMALADKGEGELFSEAVLVSHEDALKLLKILKSKLGGSGFIRKIYFCENVFLDKKSTDDACKAIYTKGRSRNGKSNVMSSAKWAEVLARLGVRRSGIYHTARPMEYDYFLKMERKLLKTLKLHPAVTDLLMRLISEERDFVSDVRSGKVSLKPDSLLHPITDIIESLSEDTASRKNDINVSSRKMAAAMFLVADAAVLFTTRDWTTTGTLSAVSSNAVLLSA